MLVACCPLHSYLDALAAWCFCLQGARITAVRNGHLLAAQSLAPCVTRTVCLQSACSKHIRQHVQECRSATPPCFCEGSCAWQGPPSLQTTTRLQRPLTRQPAKAPQLATIYQSPQHIVFLCVWRPGPSASPGPAKGPWPGPQGRGWAGGHEWPGFFLAREHEQLGMWALNAVIDVVIATGSP